ncbi:MAG: hypothetical protein H6744_13005, partial [Deltaproteobacteria bacterium]|nr:hypothetical protein [Deltaproteobacteria bacterium]
DTSIPGELPADDFAWMRLRVTPSLTFTGNSWRLFKAYQLLLDADLTSEMYDTSFRAPLAYDPVQQGRSRSPDPRLMQAYFLAAGKRVALKVGLTRSAWGQGILANDGEQVAAGAARSAFGFSRTADRVARFQLAFFPLDPPRRPEGSPPAPQPLTIAVAGDAVVDDDTADWGDGDRAYNAIAAVLGEVGAFRGGVYVVHRRQSHEGGGDTQVTVLDVQARFDIARGRVDAWLEAEAAGLFGTTDYTRSAILDGRYDIRAAGGVGRLGVRHGIFEGAFEVGAASADDNPFDTQIRGFSFDREYRVGLLMFNDYLRKTSAVTAYNLADETYRIEPARGFDRVATGGSITGATYINPRIAFKPVKGLTVMAGYLTASSQGSYTDAYRTGINGGLSTGPNGAIGASSLGHELDLGVDYVHRVGRVTLHGRLEGAWFSPGRVFASRSGGDPEDVLGAWLHAEASW